MSQLPDLICPRNSVTKYPLFLRNTLTPVPRNNVARYIRAQPVNYFKVRGLVPPGSYSNRDNQKPGIIGVSKSGKGVGKKKQTTSKLGQKNTHQATNLNKADERWLNIYKSRSFGAG